MYNMDVIFRKVDNVYGVIETEDFDFLILLREKFSFFAENYQFQPAYKNKMWDGKIRLLGVDGRIYLGLWEEVENFCKANNKVCHIDPSIKPKTLPREKFNNFVEWLNIHIDGDKVSPYDYQQDAAHWALEQQRCLLLSPTSSGKSLIQYMLCRMYELVLNTDVDHALVIVPRSSLVLQLFSDFADYSSGVEWDPKEHVFKIKGSCKDTDKFITISTFQSLTNAKTKPPREWFKKFKAVMVDEVHTATAKSVIYILESCTEAEWKVGLTGTFDESKTNEMTLRGLFGPVKSVITTKELMDAGTVARLNIKVGLVKHPDKVCKHMRSAPRGPKDDKGKQKRKRATYAEEIDIITNSLERNRFIMRFTANLKGNTILMINKVEHGQNLLKWMRDALPDRKIYLYTGATKTEEREAIRRRMEKEENSIIIGSLGVLSTGISIKRLDNMVFAHPTKSKVKTLQSVGRLLRKCKFTDNIVQMFDLVDDYRIGAFTNYVYDHGQDRVRFYNDQMFDYEVFNINLEEAA